MADTVSELVVRFTADPSGLDRGVKESSASLRQIATAGNAAGAALKTTGAAASLAGAQVGAAGGQTRVAGALVQQYTAQLAALSGGLLTSTASGEMFNAATGQTVVLADAAVMVTDRLAKEQQELAAAVAESTASMSKGHKILLANRMGMQGVAGGANIASFAVMSLGQGMADAGQFGMGMAQGLRAVTNNAQMAVQSFMMLIAQAGSGTKAMQAFWAAMKGPAGFLLAFSAISAAIEGIANASQGSKAKVNELGDALSSVANIHKEYQAKVDLSMSEVEAKYDSSIAKIKEMQDEVAELRALEVKEQTALSGGAQVFESNRQPQIRQLEEQITTLNAYVATIEKEVKASQLNSKVQVILSEGRDESANAAARLVGVNAELDETIVSLTQEMEANSNASVRSRRNNVELLKGAIATGLEFDDFAAKLANARGELAELGVQAGRLTPAEFAKLWNEFGAIDGVVSSFSGSLQDAGRTVRSELDSWRESVTDTRAEFERLYAASRITVPEIEGPQVGRIAEQNPFRIPAEQPPVIEFETAGLTTAIQGFDHLEDSARQLASVLSHVEITIPDLEERQRDLERQIRDGIAAGLNPRHPDLVRLASEYDALGVQIADALTDRIARARAYMAQNPVGIQVAEPREIVIDGDQIRVKNPLQPGYLIKTDAVVVKADSVADAAAAMNRLETSADRVANALRDGLNAELEQTRISLATLPLSAIDGLSSSLGEAASRIVTLQGGIDEIGKSLGQAFQGLVAEVVGLVIKEQLLLILGRSKTMETARQNALLAQQNGLLAAQGGIMARNAAASALTSAPGGAAATGLMTTAGGAASLGTLFGVAAGVAVLSMLFKGGRDVQPMEYQVGRNFAPRAQGGGTLAVRSDVLKSGDLRLSIVDADARSSRLGQR